MTNDIYNLRPTRGMTKQEYRDALREHRNEIADRRSEWFSWLASVFFWTTMTLAAVVFVFRVGVAVGEMDAAETCLKDRAACERLVTQ